MQGPLIDTLARQGVTRRTFFKYCATLASLMALPPAAGRAMAEAMAAAPAATKRPSVIWLPFQECTGCTESITRSHSPTIEGLIFDAISLDYQETLMAAAGHQAEEALHKAMKDNEGNYLLIVDGSIPLGMDGAIPASPASPTWKP
jgi:hydrogenase small subunit